jgi:flagellar FliL protein
MAEKTTANKPAENAEPPAAPANKGKVRKLAIAGIAAVLCIGGGAGAYLALGKRDAETDEAKAAPKRMPVFVDLDTFTVNLPGDDADRFMQVKLVAEVRDNASGEMVKTLMPSVRNEILLLLGSKSAGEVATREGKEKLAAEIVLAANKPLAGTPAANGVEGVNFTHLIVQ